jgi:hypothetical protein
MIPEILAFMMTVFPQLEQIRATQGRDRFVGEMNCGPVISIGFIETAVH